MKYLIVLLCIINVHTYTMESSKASQEAYAEHAIQGIANDLWFPRYTISRCELSISLLLRNIPQAGRSRIVAECESLRNASISLPQLYLANTDKDDDNIGLWCQSLETTVAALKAHAEKYKDLYTKVSRLASGSKNNV